MVDRRFPHPRDLAPLMQFKKPEFDSKKRRLEKALTIYDLRRIAQRRTGVEQGSHIGDFEQSLIGLVQGGVMRHLGQPQVLTDPGHVDQTGDDAAIILLEEPLKNETGKKLGWVNVLGELGWE